MKKVITKKEAFKRGVRLDMCEDCGDTLVYELEGEAIFVWCSMCPFDEDYNPTKGMIKDSLFGGKKLDVKRYKAELERARLMDIKKRRAVAIRYHKDKEMGLRFF